jgi:hypothetical protein
MTEHTNTKADLREALSKKGITSGAKLARYLGSKGVIFFVRGPEGWENAHAELRLLDAGDSIKFYAREDDARVREACVDRAVEQARELLGVFEWSSAPFSNCWLPSEDIEDLNEDFAQGQDFPKSA